MLALTHAQRGCHAILRNVPVERRGQGTCRRKVQPVERAVVHAQIRSRRDLVAGPIQTRAALLTLLTVHLTLLVSHHGACSLARWTDSLSMKGSAQKVLPTTVCVSASARRDFSHTGWISPLATVAKPAPSPRLAAVPAHAYDKSRCGPPCLAAYCKWRLENEATERTTR